MLEIALIVLKIVLISCVLSHFLLITSSILDFILEQIAKLPKYVNKRIYFLICLLLVFPITIIELSLIILLLAPMLVMSPIIFVEYIIRGKCNYTFALLGYWTERKRKKQEIDVED